MRRQRGVYEREPGSGDWSICWKVNGRRHREHVGKYKGAYEDACALYFKRKTEARRAAKFPELVKEGVTLGELAKDALAYAEREYPRSFREQSYRMGKLVAHFGRETLAARIDARAIENFLANLGRTKKAATINRSRSLLSLTFRLAVEGGKLAANPVRAVRRKKENNKRDRYLTLDEEARLREVMEREYPHRVPELDIAIHTGLRRSSQYALDWSDVNFESDTVRIRWAKPGEKQFVRLNEVSRAAFLALHSGPIADLRAKVSRRVGTPADFSVSPGQVFDLRSPRAWFERALKLAGIQNFSWHDLRHTAASRQVNAGVPLKAVQEFLGHKSITTTERYAHLSPEFQLQAVNALVAYHPSRHNPERHTPRRAARQRRVFAVIPGGREASQVKGGA